MPLGASVLGSSQQGRDRLELVARQLADFLRQSAVEVAALEAADELNRVETFLHRW